MRFLRIVAASLLTASVAAIFVPTVSAQPHIVQTGCDTLSLDPLRVRVEFSVVNPEPNFAVCQILLDPIQNDSTVVDTCRILGCESAPGWSCSFHPPSGSADWIDLSGTACIGPGETRGPFAVVLDPQLCCFQAIFINPVPEPVFFQTVCFECEQPVQAHNGTWGRLKVRYR